MSGIATTAKNVFFAGVFYSAFTMGSGVVVDFGREIYREFFNPTQIYRELRRLERNKEVKRHNSLGYQVLEIVAPKSESFQSILKDPEVHEYRRLRQRLAQEQADWRFVIDLYAFTIVGLVGGFALGAVSSMRRKLYEF